MLHTETLSMVKRVHSNQVEKKRERWKTQTIERVGGMEVLVGVT